MGTILSYTSQPFALDPILQNSYLAVEPSEALHVSAGAVHNFI